MQLYTIHGLSIENKDSQKGLILIVHNRIYGNNLFNYLREMTDTIKH